MLETDYGVASLEQLQCQKLHQAICAAATVTIEFGTGNSPLFEAQPNTPFGGRDLYVGVNLESKQHRYLAEGVDRIGGFAILAERSAATGAPDVPLPAGVADVAFLGNVFGEPDSPHVMHMFKQADWRYHGHSSTAAKTATLHEAARLLKPDGRLVVLETNTPFGYRVGHAPYAAMADLLCRNGYGVEVALGRADAGWLETVTPFAEPQQWWDRTSYLVVAQKSDQQ